MYSETLSRKEERQEICFVFSSAGFEHLHFGTCGLGGIYSVNVTFTDGDSCSGTLSDVYPTTCSSRDSLSLDLGPCRHDYPSGQIQEEIIVVSSAFCYHIAELLSWRRRTSSVRLAVVRPSSVRKASVLGKCQAD